MTLSKQIKRTAAALALILWAGSVHAETILVVSSNNTVPKLSSQQVANIYLGKTTRLPNGEAVVPIDQSEGSRLREEFYLKLSDMTPAQIKAHWSRIIFTGKGRPPKEVANNTAMKQTLLANPHAIGYIESRDLDDSVKPVLVLP